MAQIQYDVTYTESRNRLTNAFRVILAIPHLIVSNLWSQVVNFLAVIQWFIVLFTGKRNDGIYNFQNQWLGYASRVWSYSAMTYDPYPKFGTDPTGVPVMFAHEFEQEPPNRLTNGLRLIWAIPALLLTIALVIASFFASIGQWFVIVFTGKANPGIQGFVTKSIRYCLQTEAYVLLMTDTYPKY